MPLKYHSEIVESMLRESQESCSPTDQKHGTRNPVQKNGQEEDFLGKQAMKLIIEVEMRKGELTNVRQNV